MSTRAFVASGTRAGAFVAVYVHQNGYPGDESQHGVGLRLRDHYSSKSAVEKLMAVGGMSQLSERPEDITTAYGDSAWQYPAIGLEELHREAWSHDCEWMYLWTGAQWLHCRIEIGGSNPPPIPALTPVKPEPVTTE